MTQFSKKKMLERFRVSTTSGRGCFKTSHTYRRTLRRYDWIGPVGLFSENLKSWFSKNRPLADSFIELRCVSICPPLHVTYFEASHWPLEPGPLIIGPGTTIHATIRALPSAHYHLRYPPRYHPRYHPRTTICALPSAHYHLLFNHMIADTKA